MLTSKSFELNTKDLLVLGKGALIVGAAAVLTYVAENLTKVDLGANGIFIVPIVTVMIDAAVKWLKDNSTNVE